MATMDVKEQVEVSINGERAALLDLNVRMSETDPKNSLDIKTPPIHINAGPQRISAAFIQRFDGPVDDLLVPLENTLADVNITFGVTALPHMRDMTILGPQNVTGVSDSVSRRRVFTQAGFEKQVRRMLADKRSDALSTRFAGQWLRLQDLEKIHPDYLIYPQYDDTLAQAMQRETELFFDSIVREDRPVLDLLTADYSFVNERLAKHYDIANVTGSAFKRVQMPEYRRGLLGQGSILTLTSVADRTSPVQRGKWVMEVLLGSPPPPPPPNVPALDETKGIAGGKMLTTRERMEEHRKNPACTSCHRVIDPLGLALENFDATGAWRIKDNEVPVDSVGDLYDGTKMEGPRGLQQALLKHSDVFLLSFTENLMTYALGRRIEYSDMPAIRAIVRDAAKNNNRMSSFILGVANSAAFRMAKAAEPKQLTTDAGAAPKSNSSSR
jgi:hypothetical protein